MIRRQIAMELGVIKAAHRIRDNTAPRRTITRQNPRQAVGKGVTILEKFQQWTMAHQRDSGAEATIELAFGLPAYWITSQRVAELLTTVVEATSVLATHLTG